MANTLGLFFKIGADQSEADEALKLLQKDMAALTSEVGKVGRAFGLLPSQTADVIKQFNALATAEERAAFAVKNFGEAGLQMLPTMERIRTEMGAVSTRASEMAARMQLAEEAARALAAQEAALAARQAELNDRMRASAVAQQALAKDTSKLTSAFTTLVTEGVNPFFSSLGQVGVAMRTVMGLLGPIGLGAGALVGGLAAAAVSAGNFARETERIAQSTGLTLEAVQALRAEMSQVGGSFVDVIDAVNQFANRIGDARDNNKDAAKSFRELGIDIGDSTLKTTDALDQMLKILAQMPPGIERTRLAAQNFGEEGGRQITQILDLSGGLDGLIKKYKEAGQIIEDETLKGAAAFDRMIESAERWAKAQLNAFGTRIIKAYREEIEGLKDSYKLLGDFQDIFLKKQQQAQRDMQDFVKRQLELQRPGPRIETAEEKAAREKAEKEAAAAAKKAAEEAARLAEQAAKKLAEDTVKAQEEAVKARLAAVEAGYEQEKLLLEAALKDELISVENFTERMIIERQKLTFAQLEAVEAQRQIDLSQQTNEMGRLAVNIAATATQQKIYNDEIKETSELEADAPRKIEKIIEALVKRREEVDRTTVSLQRQRDAFLKLTQEQFARTLEAKGAEVPITPDVEGDRAKQLIESIHAQREALSPLTEAWRVMRNEATTAIDEVIAKMDTSHELLVGIFNDVMSAAQQMFAAFILTGKSAGAAFKKMTADILAALAVQSIVKAIYNIAEGYAAMARYDAYAADMHFKAAAKYLLVGITAAAVGAGIGAGGGLQGGGAAGGGGAGEFGGTPAPVTINQGGVAGQLGIRPDVVVASDMASAITTFNNKFNSTTPGNVIVAGAGERPDAVATATLEQSRRDSGFGRELLSNWGVT